MMMVINVHLDYFWSIKQLESNNNDKSKQLLGLL